MNRVDYLRVSLIDRCNFRCSYCMPEEDEIKYMMTEDILTDREILFLFESVFIPLGFAKFRLTGGEPLLRPNLVELVRKISQLSGVKDLSLTTNGYFLDRLALPLFQAGLRRINISLDSLDPLVFYKITGRNHWQRVWEGILTAHAVGFDPLKLNVVVMPGVNEKEVLDLAALTIDRHWHIRFIEFMPIGNTTYFDRIGWVDSAVLRKSINDRFGLQEGFCLGNGPADVFQIPGAKGTLGFISQMSECFCERCNRLRLSANGWLRPCLLNETGELNLQALLRTQPDPQILQNAVTNLLEAKALIHFQDRERGYKDKTYHRTMSQIGG